MIGDFRLDQEQVDDLRTYTREFADTHVAALSPMIKNYGASADAVLAAIRASFRHIDRQIVDLQNVVMQGPVSDERMEDLPPRADLVVQEEEIYTFIEEHARITVKDGKLLVPTPS